METYIFILGRDPELSVQELCTYLKVRNISYKILERSELALVLETSSIDPETMIHALGGMQKIAKVILSLDGLYTGTENKLRYAVSCYDGDDDGEEIKETLKVYFKEEGLRATIKKSSERLPFISPTEARNVLEVIVYKKYLGKTVAVFDPREHKERDTQRPVQRAPQAISIRLAKILLNLSGAKPGETIVDPFCGIGTIVQEAILQGINAIGVDNDFSSIEASKKNLLWIKNRYDPLGKYTLLKGNARQFSSLVQKADHVVTEPDLGPYLTHTPTDQEAQKIINQLQPLYAEVLRECAKIHVKSLVIITPRLIARSKKTYAPQMDILIRKEKFRCDAPILYRSPTSKILREIWVLHRA